MFRLPSESSALRSVGNPGRILIPRTHWDECHPESVDHETTEYRYWHHWLAALESLLAEHKLCEPGDLEDRVRAFAQRAPGHDHDH